MLGSLASFQLSIISKLRGICFYTINLFLCGTLFLAVLLFRFESFGGDWTISRRLVLPLGVTVNTGTKEESARVRLGRWRSLKYW